MTGRGGGRGGGWLADFQTGDLMEGRGGLVRREVGFNTERFYANTTVRLEFFNVSLRRKFLQNGHRHIREF